MILLGVAASAAVAFLAVLTGVGAYRRSGSLGRSVVSAIGFPLTWITWYVLDELLKRPARSPRSRHDHVVLAP